MCPQNSYKMNIPDCGEISYEEVLDYAHQPDVPEGIYAYYYEKQKKYGELLMERLIKRWRERKPDELRFRKIWLLQKELTFQIDYLDTRLRIEEEEEERAAKRQKGKKVDEFLPKNDEIQPKDDEIQPKDDEIQPKDDEIKQ